MRASPAPTGLRRHPLAVVIAVALAGLAFAVAHADTLPVTSCADDDSPGTLRSVIESAADGDTIDMTQLTCGTITLQRGMIDLSELASLTIAGPGQERLTISGGGVSPVFNAAGSYVHGVFTLRDLTVAHAHMEPSKYQGAACASIPLGVLTLQRVTLADCHAYLGSDYGLTSEGGAVVANGLVMVDSTITGSSVQIVGAPGTARGGGASAATVTLVRSTISGNSAVGQNAAFRPGGGGLFVANLVMLDSIITGNTCASTDTGQDSPGGGIYVEQNATIVNSLIANNTTDGDGGGLFKGDFANMGRGVFTIQNATIAGNSAGGSGGGLYSQWPVTITNSTIAGNTSGDGGAVRLMAYTGLLGTGWPDFESTIIAGNATGPSPEYAADLIADPGTIVFGAHNFIGDADPGITLPPDTLRGDPRLNALADNGGRSETMAPMSGSPVIDAGANALGLVTDQRGPGFPRVVGSAADIGAYEVQSSPMPQAIRQLEPVKPAIAAHHVPTVLLVTSCADDGSSGTLRAVAAQALDGDTIDLTELTCSTITLTQGPIAIGLLGPNLLYSLNIAGPGQDALTVSGNGTSGVFLLGAPSQYRDPGVVSLSDLTVADGAKYDTAACIAAFSSYLNLYDVTVSDCHVRTAGGGSALSGRGGGAVGGRFNVQLVDSTISDSSITAIDRNVASGGGVSAFQATLLNSTISGNSVSAPMAYAYQGYRTGGGGVFSSGRLYVIDSTIAGNSVEATEPGEDANGGGVAANSVFTIAGSIFTGNSADGIGGGAIGSLSSYHLPVPTAPSGLSGISNSTFTGNSARLAGAFADANELPVANSTIAFNASQYGGAVAILDSGTALKDYTLYLDSTIIASNTIDGAGGHAPDLATSPNLTLTVIGSNNLVGSADPNVTLPPDTLGGDPLLLPLADNGGPTWTMALASGSPAIDTGSNPWSFDTDQRGQGFARVYGSAADIGAYEVQPAGDVVFVSGFDD